MPRDLREKIFLRYMPVECYYEMRRHRKEAGYGKEETRYL